MNDRDLYLSRLDAERPAFLRVFRALPVDQLGYRPHERSSSAGELVWQLATGHEGMVEMVRTGRMEGRAMPAPSLDAMIATFERSWRALREAAARLDDGGWRKPGQLLADGKVIVEKPLGEFLWFVLFDAIHHRGQLTAYLRPMGAKVPAVYGASADEDGAA